MQTQRLEWIFDPSAQTLDLRFALPGGKGQVHAWIHPRPFYCDRGHWEFNIHAPSFGLDASDSFPRYFMRLGTALEEAELWMRWRIFQDTQTPGFARLLHVQDGRLAQMLDRGGWTA